VKKAISPLSAEASAEADAGRESAGTELFATKPAEPLVLRPKLPYWRRRPIAAAFATLSVVSIAAVAALELATGTPIPWGTAQVKQVSPQPSLASVIVLPFAVETPGQAQDPAFPRLLTHDLTATLARFGDLRIISDRTADLYRERDVDVAKLGDELGVRYAIVGHVQQSDTELRASIQLVDTATRTTLWSDQMQREPGEPTQRAQEIARSLARMVGIQITYAEARGLPFGVQQLGTVHDLLLRGHVAEMRAYLPENVAAALRYYEEALRRAPHNRVAMLGIARMNIIAAMNFVDLDQPPDIPRAENLLNEVLAKSPNWAGAHYTLGLLQKYRGQFAAGMQSFQRSLELNPTFLPARGQIGTLLTRMGQPEKGLETVRESIRLASPNDPGLGFLYLFAGEAELELGHEQAALSWIARANTVMPGAPLVQAWLASVHTAIGDQATAAKYVAALKRMAPAGAQRFAARKIDNSIHPNGYRRSRILQELHVALTGPLG
jgi:adenylate cyclase